MFPHFLSRRRSLLLLVLSLLPLARLTLAATAGIDAPGATVYPNGGLLLTGSTPRFNYNAKQTLFDPATGYAYTVADAGILEGYSTDTLRLYKIDLGGSADQPRLLGAASIDQPSAAINSAAIDSAAGYAYVACGSVLVKLALGAGETAPHEIGSTPIGSGNDCYIVGLDPAAGFIYLTSNHQLYKLALGQGDELPTVISSLPLYEFASYREGVLDSANGYLYICAANSGGNSSLVKISLYGGPSQPGQDPAPVILSTLDLPANSAIKPIGIDATAGYAWFVSLDGTIKVFKVALGSGDDPSTFVGAASLPLGGNILPSTALIVDSGNALIGTTGNNPSQVLKVDLGAGAALPAYVAAITLQADEQMLSGSGFFAAHGYAFFVAANGGGRMIKVAPGSGPALPVRLGAAISNINLSNVRLALNDPNGAYTLLVTHSAGPGGFAPVTRIQKLSLGTAQTMPEPLGESLRLDQEEGDVLCGVLDATGTYAYLCFNTNPGSVTKIGLGALHATPRRVGRVTFDAHDQAAISAVIVRDRHQAWFGTNQNPGHVVKMALGDGDALPTLLGRLTLSAGEPSPFTAAVDGAGVYAYFGTNSSPGRIVKVALGDGVSSPTRIGALTLPAGESYPYTSALDSGSNTAVFGTYTDPGRIVKVALGTGANLPTRVGAVTLAIGENKLASALLDAAVGRAYFGTLTSPGKVVSIALGAPADAPTRLGALTLPVGEDQLYGGVLNPAARTAIFPTFTPQSSAHRLFTSQAGQLKMTRFTLPSFAQVQSVSFYSHVAAGNLRLALYREEGPNLREIAWQSPSTSNTATQQFIEIPISAGTPSQLKLNPGSYFLAWQIDTAASVPSFSPGAADQGAYLIQPYGSFPGELNQANPATSWTSTSDAWSGYIQYTIDTQADPVWLQVGNPD